MGSPASRTPPTPGPPSSRRPLPSPRLDPLRPTSRRGSASGLLSRDAAGPELRMPVCTRNADSHLRSPSLDPTPPVSCLQASGWLGHLTTSQASQTQQPKPGCSSSRPTPPPPPLVLPVSATVLVAQTNPLGPPWFLSRPHTYSNLSVNSTAPSANLSRNQPPAGISAPAQPASPACLYPMLALSLLCACVSTAIH